MTHAVFGHPVAHSLSPRIHAAFAAQLGIPMRYGAIDAPPDTFAEALAAFAGAGGRGANVTLPHKQAALALCTTTTARARRAGAVNTLVRIDDGWHGDITDGSGLLRDLARHRIGLPGRNVLILGAGGAARGIAGPLLDAGIASLAIANRTRATAAALANAMADARARPLDIDALGMSGAFDIVINATSATRTTTLPAWPATVVHAGTACLDLGYGDAATAFLAWSRTAGAAAAIDGLGMLVEQAAESFSAWHGAWPDAEAVLHMLGTRRDTSGFPDRDPLRRDE